MNSPPIEPALSSAAPTREQQLTAEEVLLRDQRLDEELEQSFPASDPLPWHHDIEPSARAVKPVDTSPAEKTP